MIGAVLLTVLSALLIPQRSPSATPLQRVLTAAARSEQRPLLPRIGGLAWAPYAPRIRGDRDSALAAEAVLASRDDRHATAVAQLLTRHDRQAVATLQAIDEAMRTAAIWSDLAAAQYQLAITEDRPEALKDALAAADAALHLEPLNPEALFNRALVIERLGVRSSARKAWQKYLSVNDDPRWANEAAAHLRELDAPPRDFRAELERGYDELATGKLVPAEALAAAFPQEVRSWAESEILARWAEAFLHGDDTAAMRHLAVARSFALALGKRNGDSSLAETTEKILTAGRDDRERYAKAFLTYREGRIAYSRLSPAKAEPLLRDAAVRFASVRSPMALTARYFVACTKFDQGKIDEAGAELERLMNELPRSAKALQAQVEWELALCAIARTQWQRAASGCARSLAIFKTLGESRNEAAMHALLGDVSGRLGDFRTSWRQCVFAIRELSSKNDDIRFRTALAGATQAVMMQNDWRAAASMAGLELEVSDSMAPDAPRADVLLRRALIEVRRGDTAAASSFTGQAATIIASIKEASLRSRFEADLHYALALTNAADPLALTASLDFHKTKGRRMFVPDILLARAFAYRAAGDRAAAWNDVREGIEYLEGERSEAPSGYERAALFDSARSLFTTAIAMQLEGGEVREAFAYADRFRARVLLDGVQQRPVPYSMPKLDALPAGNAIVEYVLLPHRLLIFVARGGEVRVVERAIKDGEIERMAATFVSAVAANDSRPASALNALLIAPIRALIGDAATLVIVPDAALQALPFAALFDPATHRYLIEERAVVVAPSAAAYLALRPRSMRAAPRAVIVGDPQRADVESLYGAAREMNAVAALYPTSVVLRGERATRELFLDSIRDADVVHFAGHGVATPGSSALLFAGNGATGRLFVDDVAALHLPKTAVVVLAACESAAGETRRSEGTWSVAHGFLVAGVPSVIATLWTVDDDLSAPFFVRLHEHLRAGARPADALRLTQIESIQRGVPMEFWAAVQISGS
jgi:CHAT domain-containing protein